MLETGAQAATEDEEQLQTTFTAAFDYTKQREQTEPSHRRELYGDIGEDDTRTGPNHSQACDQLQSQRRGSKNIKISDII